MNEDPRWEALRELLGLKGLYDGLPRETVTPEQIITHVRYLAQDRARLLYAALPYPPERNQPAIAELAERLAKVEDRLATIERGDAHDYDAVNKRIDKVVEITGERISGLVDQVANHEGRLETQSELNARRFGSANQRIDELRELLGADNAQEGERAVLARLALVEIVLKSAFGQDVKEFPTGGATTAEAAADAVLPVPQRGDRVRLEGAKTLAFYSVPDGWYDVAGQNGDAFQIRVPQFGGDWLPYIPNANEGLKEVRHAENT